MPALKTQYLIVGQGLAGSVLAHVFLQNKLDVHVLSNASLSASSLISAGLWNPVVFKRMTQSWKAAELIPDMHTFFAGAEKMYGRKFLQKRKMIKFFTEQQEIDLWKKKSKAELSAFIDEEIYDAGKLHIEGIEKPAAGFSYVTESGNVNTYDFVQAVRQQLMSEGRYTEDSFDVAQLKKEKSVFVYKEIEAEQVIFCQGHLHTTNPFFNYIPFKPAKGELLVFECPDLHLDVILNKGIFVLPLGNGFFKCGSTYEWSDLSDTCSLKGQEELEDKLKKLVRLPFSVHQRMAGVRPSVIDRRPVIGEHPEKKGMWIFNGMGTKAVMLAPFFAAEFCNFVQGKGSLSEEITINRFNT